MYKGGKSKGKDIVKSGYHDMLRMAELINPFLVVLNADGKYIPKPMLWLFAWTR